MDPTIEALTIHPAAWAALFQGLAEGIAYGLAVVASVLVVIVAVVGCFGGRKQAEETLDHVAVPFGEQVLVAAAPRPAPRELRGLVPMVWTQHRVHATRRRRPCQRVTV
jgi:hypothetical protein